MLRTLRLRYLWRMMRCGRQGWPITTFNILDLKDVLCFFWLFFQQVSVWFGFVGLITVFFLPR